MSQNFPEAQKGEQKAKRSLVAKIAERYSVEPDKMLTTLKRTAFRQSGGDEITNEQMMALLIVADQYGLNPFTKEIYAFPDKRGGIVPVVGIDGWSRIINDQEQMDGMEFNESETVVEKLENSAHRHKACPSWIECIIYRKDRERPYRVKEHFDECYREMKDPGPWQSHTRRMLRHKAMIQCSRVAFGFTGIYDPDEAERIVERNITPESDTARANRLNAEGQKKGATIEGEYDEASASGEPEAKDDADMLAELIEKSKQGPLPDEEKDLMRTLLATRDKKEPKVDEEFTSHIED